MAVPFPHAINSKPARRVYEGGGEKRPAAKVGCSLWALPVSVGLPGIGIAQSETKIPSEQRLVAL